MTIEETIETVTSIKRVCRGLLPPKEQKALSISIEALKAFKEGRIKPGGMFFHDLPGETKEGE